MNSLKLVHKRGFTFLLKVMVLLALFSSSASMTAASSNSASDGLTQLHTQIAALPFRPDIIQQMLDNIETAQSQISAGDMGAAREATLDFCRKVEWYRYQIGHQKVNDMFNQAMVIAVDLHNASIE